MYWMISLFLCGALVGFPLGYWLAATSIGFGEQDKSYRDWR